MHNFYFKIFSNNNWKICILEYLGIIIAIFLGLYYSWKLGLVCTVFFPLLIVAIMTEMKITMGVDSVEKKAFEDSAKLAIEAITNIRTVAGQSRNF